MPLRIGIVGLPNVGKSTLFNALTRTRAAQAANYPFCTIDPNIGIVEVPDERLEKLASIVKPATVIPATVEFVDIAGLVKDAHKGEGLGNQFLHAIREVHAICHIVRGFIGTDVIHVEGTVDPKRDRETIELELTLADLDLVEKRMEKISGATRTGDKEKQKELVLLERVRKVLQEGGFAIELELKPEEGLLIHDLHLLTMKPLIYTLNVSEQELSTVSVHHARELLGLPEHASVILISAKIEEDLQDLSREEAAAFLKELSVASSSLDRLIAEAYRALGYITFFTAGPKEVRAWNITTGTLALEAAGTIHTDFERGFIRAEVISFADYMKYGGEGGAKEAGKLRIEGKEYVMQDGDVVHFRFNV